MKDTAVLPWRKLLPETLPTPCFVVDEDRLAANLDVLGAVRKRTGAKVLLALKGFAMFSVFSLLRETLDGTCASSPHEARLGREMFGREVHTFAAGYSERDVREIGAITDHIIFNSFAQLERFLPILRETRRIAVPGPDGREFFWPLEPRGGNYAVQGKALSQDGCADDAPGARGAIGAATGHPLRIGLRLNPEHSEGAAPIYDPCSPDSRLGIRRSAFAGHSPESLAAMGISGFHFHTLCEQDAPPLERTLTVVEEKFGRFLPHLRWLNFGGGHHITKPGYDLDLLCSCIERVQNRYGLDVYLEPGEAVALNSGVLASTVLDVVEADMPVAILDTSAAAHMPDVLEMPYRPEVVDASLPGERAWTCRLAGKSCLAGDVIGEYSFDAALQPGDRLIFLDMAHYSMVKTNTFNGLGLPGIALLRRGTHKFHMVRSFGYEDFATRLS